MAITKYELDQKIYYEVYVCGADSAGRRWQKRKRAIETLKKAQTIEFEFKRQLALARERAVPLRFHEWFEQAMNRMKLENMPSTVIGYRSLIYKWVYPYWKDKEIQAITKGDVYDLVFVQCKEIKAEWSRRNLIKTIKRIFQMAIEEGLVDRNPCLGIMIRVPDSIMKVLTPNEVQILLTEAKLTGHRFYPIWVFALMTGMRSGEMVALKWTDIDLENRLISVHKQWTSKNGLCHTKTKRNRLVPVSDELYQFLIELKLARGNEETVLPHLTEWENGEQARVLREFCEATGITQVRFHDLRATFITNLLSRGESLARVMAIVGHSELKTTNGYLRKAGVDLKGGTDKLSFKVPKLDGQVISLKKVE